MTITHLLRGSAIGAVAFVLAGIAPPPVEAAGAGSAESIASAQPDRSERVRRNAERRFRDRSGRRAERRAQRPARPDRARRAERRDERRAERRADRSAERREQSRRARRAEQRIERRTERRAGNVERRERDAARIDRRAARQAERGAARRAERRDNRRADRRDLRTERVVSPAVEREDRWYNRRVDGGRNRNYADRTRDRSYGGGRRAERREDRRAERREERRVERRAERRAERRLDRQAERRWDRRADRRAERRWHRREARRDWRRWNRNAWRHDRRFAWRDHRRANRHLFRLGRYYAPFRAHRYSRLRAGFFIDSLFFQPRYFIHDPWAFRLPSVYGPYRWVRYYDDVVLVDVYTGEVVDVIHDFFW